MRIRFTGDFAETSASFLALLGAPTRQRGTETEDRLVFAGPAESGSRPALELVGSDLLTGPAPDVTAFALGQVSGAILSAFELTEFTVKQIDVNFGGVFSFPNAEATVDPDRFAAALINQNLDVKGGGGADRFTPGDLFGLEGNDTIDTRGGADVVRSGDGADTLRGGGGRDRLFGQGDNDTIRGEAGNDRLVGDTGDDFLVGGSGRDTLLGGSGNDQLRGSAGRDILDGGIGSDLIEGGNGRDIFVFNTQDGVDRISDFVDGIDRIGVAQASQIDDFETRVEGADLVVRYVPTLIEIRLLGAGTASIDAADFVVV